MRGRMNRWKYIGLVLALIVIFSALVYTMQRATLGNEKLVAFVGIENASPIIAKQSSSQVTSNVSGKNDKSDLLFENPFLISIPSPPIK